MNTAEQVENLYKSSFLGTFPYQDCFWVAKEAKVRTADLIPALDMYLADIAGYASSATRLRARPPKELIAAERTLSRSLFERFPPLERCIPFIDSGRTPDLHTHLEIAEELRSALLSELQRLNSR